jgi:hypothetical protein
MVGHSKTMKKFEEIQIHLSKNIDNINKCLQIEERRRILIVDYKGQSFIIIDIQEDTNSCTIKINENNIENISYDSTKIFKISNISKIGFIPIDGKEGFLGFGKSHCDFVFFDSYDFCFVELKVNVTSENKYNERKIESLEQLKNTINYFNINLKNNYIGLNKKAYICIPKFYPRKPSNWDTVKNNFLEEYGIELFESNHKICK